MARPRKPQWCVPGPGRPGFWRTKIGGQYHYLRGVARDSKPLVGGIPRAAWEWLAALEKGEAGRASAGSDPTAWWLCAAYLKWSEGEVEAGRLSEEQWRGQRSRLKLWLAWPGVSECKARAVPVDLLQAFFDRCRGAYSGHYLSGLGRSIRAVWRWGARPVPGRVPVRLLPANPFDGFRFPTASASVRGYVEGSDVRRFLRWAWARSRARPGLGRRFDRLFLLMLQFQRLTGCRPGEAAGLRWDAWDRVAGRLVLADHKTAHRGKSRVLYVTAPVARLLGAIERLPGRHEVYVFTHERGRGAVGRGEFSAVAGEAWPSGSAASAKVRTLRDEAIAEGVAGVEGVGPKKLVAYCNRHGYASEAVSRGFSIEHTAELLGNTPAVTAAVYTHSIESAAKRRADELARRGGSKGGG